jgi:DNA topoisomerase-3
MARGEDKRDAFMADISRYVHEVVDAIRAAAPMRAVPLPAANAGEGKKWARGRSAGRGHKPGTVKPRSSKTEAQPTALAPGSRPDVPPADSVADLHCPRCRLGHLMTGKRGWGCSRWREGCKFVVWFEEGGVRRSEADLREIVSKP